MTNRYKEDYRDINISANGVTLAGIVQTREPLNGVVTFAHGVSSSRFSPVNRYVANQLHQANIATVLVDLLTPGERSLSKQRNFQSNIQLIASRLMCVIEWIKCDEMLNTVPLGIFGTNISAVAAISAANKRKDVVSALALSNARSNLIREYLQQMTAPTLLIAGDKDRAQLQGNKEAIESLGNKHKLQIISGTTHDSQNPKVLEQIATHAKEWFTLQFQPH